MGDEIEVRERVCDPLGFEELALLGGDGEVLHARARGPREAPSVVLLHGFAQTADCWEELMRGPLGDELRLVAVDLRGHGRSGKPADGYDDPELWAADLRAVVEQLGLDRPAVVAWSYAGLVLCDYLRVEGDGALGACAFVAASTRINDPLRSSTVGPAMVAAGRALTSDDPAVRARGAVAFARALRRRGATAGDVARAAAQVETVPVAIRRRLLSRRAVNDDVLARLRRPTLVVHGTADPLLLPEMGRLTARAAPGSRLSLYTAVGHSPFAEHRARFEEQLRELVARARAGRPV